MKYPIQKILTLFGLSALPTVFVSAQSPVWINSVLNGLLGSVLPGLISVLTAFAVLYFVWGVILFIAQLENEQARAEGKKRMLWGIVALFVLVSTWGFVALLQRVVGANDSRVVTTPQVEYTP